MAPKLTLHADPCTVNSHKAIAGLQIMKVPYEMKKVDYFKGEQKAPENVKINPSATVPFLVIDGVKEGHHVITESNAILQYAADLQDNESFYPRDHAHRCQVNRWLFWEASSWWPSSYIYLVEYVVKPLLGAEPDEKVIAGESERMHRLCQVLDTQLAKTKWIAGDNLTIADISIAAPSHLWEESKIPINEYPNLARWQSQIDQVPEWAETLKDTFVLIPNSERAKAAATANGAGKGLNGSSSSSTNGSVTASFNYTKDLDTPAEIYFYETDKSKGSHEPGDDPRDVIVHDGWPRAKEFDVDVNGFCLDKLHTEFDAWENEEKTRNDFYPEVVDYLKRKTGASRVLVFDHTIRAARNEGKKLTQETNTSQRSPVQLVHCDYTAEGGPRRVQQLLPNEADELLKKRVAFINVWKPIRRVVEERPLAMADVVTTPRDDFQKYFLRYRDRDGENYSLRYSPDHKWYYFPKMTPDDIILLKTFDSAEDGTARFVGHSAFIDPTSPPNAPMRESCEIRTICFY